MAGRPGFNFQAVDGRGVSCVDQVVRCWDFSDEGCRGYTKATRWRSSRGGRRCAFWFARFFPARRPGPYTVLRRHTLALLRRGLRGRAAVVVEAWGRAEGEGIIRASSRMRIHGGGCDTVLRRRSTDCALSAKEQAGLPHPAPRA